MQAKAKRKSLYWFSSLVESKLSTTGNQGLLRPVKLTYTEKTSQGFVDSKCQQGFGNLRINRFFFMGGRVCME